MEKHNYVFKAYTSNGKEIELCSGNCIYECTIEEAGLIQLGILVGLMAKYKDPQVVYNKINNNN